MNNFELRTLTQGLFEPRTQDVARDGMVGPQPSPLRAGSRSTLALWCLRKALRLGPFRGEGAAAPQLEGGAPRARGRVWRLGRVGTPALAQSGRRRALGRRGPGQGPSTAGPPPASPRTRALAQVWAADLTRETGRRSSSQGDVATSAPRTFPCSTEKFQCLHWAFDQGGVLRDSALHPPPPLKSVILRKLH